MSASMDILKAEAEMLLDILNGCEERRTRLFDIEKILKSASIEDESLYQKIASLRPENAEYRCRYEFLQEALS
jgi:hypothetical protein